MRLCKYCDDEVVDDEYHFLLVCKFTYDLRRKYLPVYYIENVSFVKFLELMKNQQKSVIFSLAKYIYNGIQKRRFADRPLV